MIDLGGKRALVCGSSRGIGRASAEALARAGATVTLLARDEAALREVHAGLWRSTQHPHDYLVADTAAPARLRDTVAAHVALVGPIDILVNNTGGPPSGPILDATPEQFLRALTMHVVCNHLLVQTLVPGMKSRNYGRIINIISTSVKQPIPGLGVSNTTRAAVAAWAKTLAGELGPFNITVNNILPGFTATERLAELFDARAQRSGSARSEIEESARRDIPAGRFAEPAEIAAGVVFLASALAAYVNGINLPIDGGRLGTL